MNLFLFPVSNSCLTFVSLGSYSLKYIIFIALVILLATLIFKPNFREQRAPCDVSESLVSHQAAFCILFHLLQSAACDNHDIISVSTESCLFIQALTCESPPWLQNCVLDLKMYVNNVVVTD